MPFYTNVVNRGNNILVRGYDEQGRPFRLKNSFNPTLYLKAKRPETNLYSLDGVPLETFNPGDINETRAFLENYKEVSGFDIYGNSNYVSQYIGSKYSQEIVWDVEKIRIFYLDIETKTESGFPNLKTTNEEILLITVYDSHIKKFITWGTRPFSKKLDNVEYRGYPSEQSMLKDFVTYWMQNYPDIITGWNTEFFDIPYLVGRIARELGESFAESLSPWGSIKQRMVKVHTSEEITYTIQGVSHLDYLALYKKFTYSKQESYRLDYICEQELGENKKENPGETFKEFYTDHWDTFVEYNIQDVNLVQRLDDKMKLIDLCMTLAYKAKVNYEDVFSPVRTWESLIYWHLNAKGVVPSISSVFRSKSEQFAGAYVKEPKPGAYKWVASFDLASLYPHLIMQYNISPETLTSVKVPCDVDSLLTKSIDTSYVVEENLSMTANGWCYRKDKRGFLPELMDQMYKDRSVYKKAMLKAEQELESDKGNNDLVKEIARLNNLQMAVKILLNSAYGAIGNQYFKYYDLRMAEGITLSGQLSIRWIGNALNKFLNETFKTDSIEYVIYIDTDSVYLNLETIVNKFCSGKSDSECISYMNNICEKIFQPFIDKSYNELATYMNAYEQKMQMKREVLADKGIWVAKKRYILNVHNSEGVQYAEPKLKIMGLEMVKSSTPAVIRERLREAVPVILSGDEDKMFDFIEKVRTEFMTLPVESIAFPRGVNGIKTYAGSPVYAKGTPIHVRGSLLYNHHVKRLGIENKYQPIKDGDKIKFVYLRTPNPIHEDVIAFSTEFPKELNLNSYINYDLQFQKVFVDALTTIVEPLGWKTERSASIESFFS